MFIETEAPARPAVALRSLVICVDDAALDDGITDAVLALAEAGRISATSAMVESPRWPDHAAALAACPTIDLGLHVNLTHGFGDHAATPLGRVVRRAYLGGLSPAALHARLEAQLDAFVRRAGRLPDHLDGHQHVQQLPQVREVLLDVVDAWWRGLAWRPWLRNGRSAERGLKAQAIDRLGAWRFAAQASRAGCPTNPALVGVHGFDDDAAAHLARLARWLADAPDGALLMTHPSCARTPGDPIGAARRMEHAVLGGAAFGALLQRCGRRVVRGSTCYGAGPQPARAPVGAGATR